MERREESNDGRATKSQKILKIPFKDIDDLLMCISLSQFILVVIRPCLTSCAEGREALAAHLPWLYSAARRTNSR